jgi:hypothetical protein
LSEGLLSQIAPLNALHPNTIFPFLIFVFSFFFSIFHHYYYINAFMRLVRFGVPHFRLRQLSTSAATMSGARFSDFDVSSQVFLERKHTFGIVNLKPIVPLHVLLIPRKEYKRLGDVPKEELNELFESVQYVSGKVQELVGGSACTIGIQDGADAVSG